MRTAAMRATTFSRRSFMKGAATAGAAGVVAPLVASPSARAAGSGRDTLVVIFQRGACDGLSLLAPYDDADYHAHRPTIGVPAATAIPVADGWGLHPNLAPLLPFFTGGTAAAVVAAGITGLPVRSHFEAQDEMERASRTMNVVTGWLGRYALDNPPSGDVPFRVVASSGSPTSLRGADVTSLAGASQLSLPNGAVTQPILEALYNPSLEPLAVTKAGMAAFDLIDLTKTLFAGAYTPAYGAAYGTSSFSQLLRAAARVIKADLGTEIITVDVGGWDTHLSMGAVGSGGTMDRLATDFGQSIGAFLTDLTDQLDRVTVLVMTEFGRQMKENSTGGLDHGEGSVLFAFGGGVHGGVHGQRPNLAADALVENAYLATTDYRDVFAEVLTKRMGAGHLDRILPSYTPKPLGLFA
jgi:uncharacterized protein (DUF1501 family)